ncbi:MAG TPA: serine/threonine-protein kinase, partial [Gemmatimonadales bacterium]|nr:serine/threonine-protein kinase [Gemmatimonadales bacterium]
MIHGTASELADALRDRYLIERELGRGGMATVYLARDLKHGRLVAIKLLRQELVAALGPDRFLREIQVTAALQHPHILPLLDSGTIDDAGGSRPYYVMPYVQGESLRDHLVRERQLPVDEAVRITGDVAAALGYAHERGVVHRDIKPENILLSGGQALVADFGIARALSAAGAERLTETGLALGTPHYMSPEQASGDPHVDGRADIYALGCVLYEMLAGEPPYTGPTAQAIIAKRMVEPIPRIRTVREGVPEEMERAITRALAKTPADRFSTAPEFAEALSRSASAPLVSRPVGTGRHWRIAAVLIVVLVGAAALRLWSRRSGPNISPSASLIAVLPFAPSGSDTALARLGRDLVFTLSSELDGLGAIRVVDAHTVLAQAKQGELYSPAEGAALARRFGAGSIVHGSLVREGAAVRLDFVLLPTDGGATPLARASVTSAPDSIAALTDSAVHVLLRQIWTRGSAPTPSLEVALKTRSVPALRAFLAGERQIVGGLWESAAASYGRAREADPAFWLAYAREQYALNWSLQEPADTLIDALQRHRFELPEPERLTTEAIVLWSRDSVALALERARQLTERYPSSWFGW